MPRTASQGKHIALALALIALAAPHTSPSVERQQIGWRQTNGPGAGIATAIAIDPLHPARIYRGGQEEQGVFKTTTGGRSWRPASDGLPPDGVWALAIDPLNPDTVYAGTGDEYGYGSGVFKTTTGGVQWEPANDGLPTSGIAALAVDPVSSATVYAAVSNAVGRVFKTVDGGATWTKVVRGLGSGGALAIDPSNHDTVYFGEGEGGVLIKTTDGGETWSHVLNQPTIALAVDPAHSTTVYVGITRGGVMKSTDGGLTWARSGLDSLSSRLSPLTHRTRTSFLLVPTV